MQAVQVPSNVKGVQRFLGLVGYYRRFIRAFAEVAKPLYILLRKEQPSWQAGTHSTVMIGLLVMTECVTKFSVYSCSTAEDQDRG